MNEPKTQRPRYPFGGPYYRLQGHDVVPCESKQEWTEARNEVAGMVGESYVLNTGILTWFLGKDESGVENDPPLLFATLVMGGYFDNHMERYSTWEQAEEGHQAVVKMVRGGGV